MLYPLLLLYLAVYFPPVYTCTQKEVGEASKPRPSAGTS
jgi:hypothetical protein